jgi:membrane fusion protein (multidrug efflux system)
MTSLYRLKAITLMIFLGLLASAQADYPAIITEVAVQTGMMRETTLQRYVLAYGVVEPMPISHNKPAASAKIAAPIAGIITQLYVKEGQAIKKEALYGF